jgi:hypothetical protein
MSDKQQEQREGHFFPLDLAPKIHMPIEWKRIKWEVDEKKTLEYNPHDIAPGHGKIIIVSKWMGLSRSVWAILNVGGKRLEHHRLL